MRGKCKNSRPPDKDRPHLTIKRNEVTYHLGKERSEVKIYKLGESKNPRTLDITPKKGEGRKELGKYELKGDVLRICLSITKDGKRPTKFESKARSGTSLEVWKRM